MNNDFFFSALVWECKLKGFNSRWSKILCTGEKKFHNPLITSLDWDYHDSRIRVDDWLPSYFFSLWRHITNFSMERLQINRITLNFGGSTVLTWSQIYSTTPPRKARTGHKGLYFFFCVLVKQKRWNNGYPLRIFSSSFILWAKHLQKVIV